MARILIVDDNPTNRKLAVALLAAEGYDMLEAVDGLEGLARAVAAKPDLIISDILMPSMDGYEFVQKLRADASIAATPVIFYTAHYHGREARNLAAACHVKRVLVKPCAAALFIQEVKDALAGTAETAPDIAIDFDREHLRLVTDQIARKAEDLGSANARFEALTDLNMQLASERDPVLLLEKVCKGARYLLGARHAVLAVERHGAREPPIIATSGMEPGAHALPELKVRSGWLGRVMTERASCRKSAADAAALPTSFPPTRACLAAPIVSLKQSFGWIFLGDKVGTGDFSADDERMLAIIGAQAGRIFENGSLYLDVQRHAAQLQIEMEERGRAMQSLRESEERFRQLAENIQDVFFIVSGDLRRVMYVSPAFQSIWGRPPGDLAQAARSWVETIQPDDAERMRREGRWDPASSQTPAEFEFRILRPDGELRWILARTFPILNHAGNLQRLVGVATDITDRKLAAARIDHLNRVYATLSGINSLIVRVTDRAELFRESCRLAVEQGRFKFAWCVMRNELTGRLEPVASAGAGAQFIQALRGEADVDGDTIISTALRLRQAVICNDLNDAANCLMSSSGFTGLDCQAIVVLPLIVAGESAGCLVLATDERGFFDADEMRLLTELAGDVSFALDHIGKNEQLNYLAYYDALTGLANRTFFHERLTQHVAAASRDGRSFALVIMDPERFDTINDMFGRHVGDALLKQLAERLIACVGAIDQVARIQSDQFAALMLDVDEAADVLRKVDAWLDSWQGAPLRADATELRISAKAGIAVFPADGKDATTLMKNAEVALKNAKTTAGERRLFYARRLSEQGAEKLALENQLRRALENEQFVLHYQPKVALESRQLTGVEALIRWQSPELGLVPPLKFIPLMEATGMIVEVGAWALRQACLDRSHWLEMRPNAPRVAVNISTVQLRRDDFVRTVADVLRLAGAEAGLDIEVTESLIMDDVAGNIERLTAIRDLGVGISIDDFGTGYSSLGYLTKLPAETLKIDRSFVIAMVDDPGAMTLISTIISLAHELKLDVVAEGVESEEQAKFLRLLKCDQMQGYLISKPLSFDAMTTYLARSKI